MRNLALVFVLLLAACSSDERGDNGLRFDMGTDPSDMRSSNMSDIPAADEDMTSDIGPVPDADVAPDAAPLVDLGPMTAVSLNSVIDRVQPMTGIVLWEDSWNGDDAKDAVQLEYAYVAPSSIVTAADTYDWQGFDGFLDRIAARGHQAVVRFYYTYPGRQTAVPEYIKDLPDYQETRGQTEGMGTSFPDWRHAELKRSTLAFYSAFADRYDDDPRIAFLQVGFGLWGEYHIYDGPNELGRHFPDKVFQDEFLRHLDAELEDLSWSLSIDAGSDEYSPIADTADLLALPFGLFDDSFMHENHGSYNESMWTLFGYASRYATSPHGGELSYYTDFDQEHALDVGGLHGRTYEELSEKFHITYMIGNDQPTHQSAARIRAAGMANGYKFRVTAFEANAEGSRVTIENEGIAPIYVDAYPTVNGVRATSSLKGLLPGASMFAVIPSGGDAPDFTIECDRLVPGQTIQFAASL